MGFSVDFQGLMGARGWTFLPCPDNQKSSELYLKAEDPIKSWGGTNQDNIITLRQGSVLRFTKTKPYRGITTLLFSEIRNRVYIFDGDLMATSATFPVVKTYRFAEDFLPKIDELCGEPTSKPAVASRPSPEKCWAAVRATCSS